MNINFPVNCTTSESRIAYCCKFHEKLRVLRNKVNVWHKDGLTESQYNAFPNKLKNRYVYAFKATAEQWEDFLKLYLQLFNIVEAKLQENRSLVESGDDWNPDIDGDIS